MRASASSAAEAAARGERWMPPEIDASLSRPKLDATVILSPKADTQALDGDKPKRTPLLALASLNADTAPSTEVCWSQLLALSLTKMGEPVLTVGRHADCQVVLSDPRVSVRHFEILARHGSTGEDGSSGREQPAGKAALVCECFLRDLSSNGTSVNGSVVGKGNSRQLYSGDEVCVLPSSRVGEEQSIAFLFRNSTESLVSPEEMLLMELQDLVTCPICMQVLYKSVSLMPCSHVFCMACTSDWMGKRRSDCPVCRRAISAVMKNHPMDGVVEAFLEANPSFQRESAEMADMDARDRLKLGVSGKLVRDVCHFEPPSRPPLPPAAPPGQDPQRGLARQPQAAEGAQALSRRVAAQAGASSPGGAARHGSSVCCLQ